MQSMRKNSWSKKISVTDLRLALGADQGCYEEWSPFKKRVLKPAIEDINSNPNTKFTVQYTVSERQNRYIDELLFEMKLKEGVAPDA